MVANLISVLVYGLRSLRRSFRRTAPTSVEPLPKQADRITSISLALLQRNGIRGVILDLDNTLVSEDDRYLSPGAELWLKQAQQAGFRFFILSNGKRRSRVEFWSTRLGIPSYSPAKKPFPEPFKRAIAMMQLHPSEVVVIGDSRHTDVFGAWLVGCPSIQVATLPHPARWWERLLGKRVQTPYPASLELWELDRDRPQIEPDWTN